MQLVKVEEIPELDRNSLWSQEDWNRKAMKEMFGIEFPEIKKPASADDDDEKDDDDDLPFPSEEEVAAEQQAAEKKGKGKKGK
jgi:hypothetical protein